MHRVEIEVTVNTHAANGRRLIAPVGMPTPHQMPAGLSVDGGSMALTFERKTGQAVALITPDDGGSVTLAYHAEDGADGHYPDAMFEPVETRFTLAADALVEDARTIAAKAGGGRAGLHAIVQATAQKFTYGHPETRYYEGLDAIPQLGCGLTEGSCVDINAYLIASLRSAGYEAGYITGYFFPKEKAGRANDGHCWVVTRHDRQIEEWDIAHHLKLGTREIKPGLNPKPGHRVALAFSKGHDFPDLGIVETKLLSEVQWVDGQGGIEFAQMSIMSYRTAHQTIAA